MGTTARGLRYPEPTDPVSDGAAAMRRLAEDVDLRLQSWRVALTAASASYSALTSVPGLSVSWPSVSGATYRVVSAGLLRGSVVGDDVRARLYVDGTQVRTSGYSRITVANASAHPWMLTSQVTGNGSSMSASISIERVGGTGTVLVLASSLDPADVIVERLT